MNGKEVINEIIKFGKYIHDEPFDIIKNAFDDGDKSKPEKYRLYYHIYKKYNENRSIAYFLNSLDCVNRKRFIDLYQFYSGTNRKIIDESIELLRWLNNSIGIFRYYVDILEQKWDDSYGDSESFMYEKELEYLSDKDKGNIYDKFNLYKKESI